MGGWGLGLGLRLGPYIMRTILVSVFKVTILVSGFKVRMLGPLISYIIHKSNRVRVTILTSFIRKSSSTLFTNEM